MKKIDIILDFDGTCVLHTFPNIDTYDIGSERVIKMLISNGHNIILSTMRSDNYLDDAINWFKKRNIELYGVQINPTQHEWTTSPKPFGQLNIDDICLGIPLKKIPNHHKFVDWERVEVMLRELKLI